MQITIKGELSIPELRQAIFETLCELEQAMAVRYSLGATLYVNPTNGFGDAVVPHDRYGTPITKIFNKGPYRSVADEYRIFEIPSTVR